MPEGSTEEERVALATDTHPTMEGNVVFYGVCSKATMEVLYLGSVPRLYNQNV
jgi:hypothetical protein